MGAGPSPPPGSLRFCSLPTPFQPLLLLGKKKRNFLACWDLPSSPLCKDKFKVVGASKFSLQPRELGPKGGQDLLKSLTNQRLSYPPFPGHPHQGDKGQVGAST